MSRLTQIIGLLYRMERDDVTALAEQLLEQRKRAWATALAELGREYGCGKPPRAPSGDDLRELRRMSREDARQIADTWNKDVSRQIERLYEANPRGNRHYYARRLEAWSAERNAWKAPSIAFNTAQQTRFYAQQAFYRANGIEPRFIFVGPPPVCEACVMHFAAGVVGQDYVDRNAAPVHVNCPHEWRALRQERIPCEDLWLG